MSRTKHDWREAREARMRPRWRWLLFCALSWCYARTRSYSRLENWTADAMAWCVLPEWIATPEEIAASNAAHVCGEECPF